MILRVESFFLEASLCLGRMATGFNWAISLTVPVTAVVAVTSVVTRTVLRWLAIPLQLTWFVLLAAGCELECTDGFDTEPWPLSRSHPSGSLSVFICCVTVKEKMRLHVSCGQQTPIVDPKGFWMICFNCNFVFISSIQLGVKLWYWPFSFIIDCSE